MVIDKFIKIHTEAENFTRELESIGKNQVGFYN